MSKEIGSDSFGSIALAELGHFDEAITLGRSVYETALAQNHAYSITVSCFGIGHALALRGDIDEALGPLEEGLRQIEIHSVAAAMPWVGGRAAYLFAKLGRTDAMDNAISLVVGEGLAQLSPSMVHPFAFYWVARAYEVAGRFAEARSFANMALSQDGLEDADVGVRAWAQWVLMECDRLQGQTDATTINQLEALIKFADQHGMLPLRAHCLSSAAFVTRNAETLSEAYSIARELKMTQLVAEIDAAAD